MSISLTQILIVALLLVLLFGRGKIADVMGEVAKGIRNFKKGMSGDSETAPPQPKPAQKTLELEAEKGLEPRADAKQDHKVSDDLRAK